ncbi:hypothetical protein V5799_022432 [Amblyomma americanum]|uniref:Uncharacterized protein n=1 Tax=Amblyomma americanum TaxID=6943 RepID=A0AAQ4FM19_AMBAM
MFARLNRTSSSFQKRRSYAASPALPSELGEETAREGHVASGAVQPIRGPKAAHVSSYNCSGSTLAAVTLDTLRGWINHRNKPCRP